MDGPGIPGPVIAIFVLFIAFGIGMTIWRVSMARSIARSAGLNPDDAGATALLTQNGLDATYLAASLRSGQRTATAVPQPIGPTATARLQELNALRDQGLVTADEYTERRKAILDAI